MSDSTGDLILNSTVAHIHARSENGPRWDPQMTESQNRSAANLILLCLEHSREIDDVPEKYPAEDLRAWKVAQFAEYEELQRSWPITDEQASEVLKVSLKAHDLGRAAAEAGAVLKVARLAVVVAETARRERRGVAEILSEYEARVEFYTRQAGAWDENGERVEVRPPRVEVVQLQKRLQAVCATATSLLEPLATDLLAELNAVKAVSPELTPWCDWCARSAVAVVTESGRVQDGSEFEAALQGLGAASSAVAAAWRGDSPPAPPDPPEPPSPEEETPQAVARRVHREVLDRARPWHRVDTRPYDSDAYEALVAQMPYASGLPPVVTELPFYLDTTAALAACVARNADDAEYRRRIEEATSLAPLSAAAHLLRHLGRIARESERLDLASEARDRLASVLSAADWTVARAWEENAPYCRALFEFSVQLMGAAEASLLVERAISSVGAAPVLTGFCSWRENVDFDSVEPPTVHRYIDTMPAWFPSDVLLAAVRREWPEVHGDADAEGETIEALVAQFVVQAEGRSSNPA